MESVAPGERMASVDICAGSDIQPVMFRSATRRRNAGSPDGSPRIRATGRASVSSWLKTASGSSPSPEAYEGDVPAGSDRGFGIVFAAAFVVVGLIESIGSGLLRLWPFAVSAGFLAAAFFRPGLLSPFNRAWLRLGLLLSRIVNPLIMAVIFFGVLTPTGFLMRLAGKDPLRLRFDREAESYWIHRTPPGPEPESMERQF